jgi:lysophospholipase L1-like esterase
MNIKSILALFLISSMSSFVWAASCTAPTLTLKDNSWKQISLPCDAHANNTVETILGGAIRAVLGRNGQLGKDWAVWEYDSGVGGYKQLTIDSVLEQGKGYWVIQATGQDLQISMPAGSTSAGLGAGRIELSTVPNGHRWNMLGNPFANDVQDIYVSYEGMSADECPDINTGCSLSIADRDGIVYKKLFRYNDETQQYEEFDGSGLDSWSGFWVATLNKANGVFPKLVVNSYKTGYAKLFLIGDSTVHNTTKGEMGWGTALKDYMKYPNNLSNQARSGASSKSYHAQSTHSWDKTQDLMLNTDTSKGAYLFVQFGHNDEDGRDGLHTDPGSGNSFYTYLKDYVTEAEGLGFTPVLITPVSRIYRYDRSHAEYAKTIRQLAQNEGVILLDLTDRSQKEFTAYESHDAVYKAFGYDDHTHFNPEGAKTVARWVKELACDTNSALCKVFR